MKSFGSEPLPMEKIIILIMVKLCFFATNNTFIPFSDQVPQSAEVMQKQFTQSQTLVGQLLNCWLTGHLNPIIKPRSPWQQIFPFLLFIFVCVG